MQVQVKKAQFQSFGGLNFMEADYSKFKFEQLITSHLGYRSPQALYSFSDVIKSILYVHAVGGEVLDDLTALKKQMENDPQVAICSADTVEYVCQELKQPSQEIVTEKDVHHTINVHDGFNKLLPALCKQGKLLDTDKGYTMDYDGHIVENTKRDKAQTYKEIEGYYAIVCSIEKNPIYVENRRGNSPENYRELIAIKKSFEQADALGIQINRFRADACCYEKETIKFLESRPKAVQYYIRAEMNANLRIALEDETDWEKAKLNHKDIEVCAIEEQVFGEEKYRRIVAYRAKVTGQLTIDQRDGYSYHAVITNDPGKPLDIINFYNHRGCEGEHHFKEFDYDFGWKKLPFPNIEMNTIYMYSTIVAYLLFNIFKHYYSGKLSFINTTMRLKNFTLHFVTLVSKWIKKGRQNVFNIYTQKDYSPIFVT